MLGPIFNLNLLNINTIELQDCVFHGLKHSLPYCIVLHSTVQYYTIQFSTVLYSTVQYYTVQYYTVQYSIVVYSTTKTRCISRISSSDGVEEANYIRVIRKELMPWSNGLETEEQEVPDHVLVVMMQSIQAGYHVSHLQLLLGVLEEGDEGSL